MEGTSVTVVLIGAETSQREWIKYELQRSWEKNNGILGIYIYGNKDRYGNIDHPGNTNFGPIFTSQYDNKQYFNEIFTIHDWNREYGRMNIDRWIEEAAHAAGR